MRNGALEISFSVMGGPMQAQGHAHMVLCTQIYGQNPQTASDAPRWRFISGKKVAIEAGMDAQTVAGLEGLGHTISCESPDASFAFGGAQLICRLDDGYLAGSDHRKDGMAAGY